MAARHFKAHHLGQQHLATNHVAGPRVAGLGHFAQRHVRALHFAARHLVGGVEQIAPPPKPERPGAAYATFPAPVRGKRFRREREEDLALLGVWAG